MSGAALRRALQARAPLLGTFLKTPCHQAVEILGRAALDFLIVDAEHAAFGRAELDRVLLAAAHVSLPTLVRVSTPGDSAAGASLDLGAAGVLFPRIRGVDSARCAVAATRFRGGTRGLSPSTRSAGYASTSLSTVIAVADSASCAWCQVETLEALRDIEGIAGIEDLDCLFIGRADLALALQVADVNSRAVQEAIAQIVAAGSRHGKALGIHINDVDEIPELHALGINLFACGSDQGWLLRHARATSTQFRRWLGTDGSGAGEGGG